MNRLFLLPRLYLGIIFADAALTKLTSGVDFARSLGGFATEVGLSHGYGWYHGILQSLVLPHAHLFATLVLIGECAVAISMLFGLATRGGAVLAIFLLLNYAAAKGLPPWSPGSNDYADIVLAIMVLGTAAGRIFGIDKSLHERFPRVPLW